MPLSNCPPLRQVCSPGPRLASDSSADALVRSPSTSHLHKPCPVVQVRYILQKTFPRTCDLNQLAGRIRYSSNGLPRCSRIRSSAARSLTRTKPLAICSIAVAMKITPQNNKIFAEALRQEDFSDAVSLRWGCWRLDYPQKGPPKAMQGEPSVPKSRFQYGNTVVSRNPKCRPGPVELLKPGLNFITNFPVGVAVDCPFSFGAGKEEI